MCPAFASSGLYHPLAKLASLRHTQKNNNSNSDFGSGSGATHSRFQFAQVLHCASQKELRLCAVPFVTAHNFISLNFSATKTVFPLFVHKQLSSRLTWFHERALSPEPDQSSLAVARLCAVLHQGRGHWMVPKLLKHREMEGAPEDLTSFDQAFCHQKAGEAAIISEQPWQCTMNLTISLTTELNLRKLSRMTSLFHGAWWRGTNL